MVHERQIVHVPGSSRAIALNLWNGKCDRIAVYSTYQLDVKLIVQSLRYHSESQFIPYRIQMNPICFRSVLSFRLHDDDYESDIKSMRT